jgi:gamma-glutamyltranspeptidase/glutathione hydrolase
MTYRLAFGRPPAVAAEAMVATSQPLATRAGLRALERGGNAADAALAAAAVQCVTEPMSTGVGGDAFAIVWRDGRADGLDAAGPAPANAHPVEPVEERGPRSVTVPGAVAGWAELSERFGRLGLDTCLEDAIDVAERGFAPGRRTRARWDGAPEPFRLSERVRLPELASTLRLIAEQGQDALYRGRMAEAIAGASWLEEGDLTSYRPRWVDPLRLVYRGVEVLELPPPTQGVVALEGLGLLDLDEPTLGAQVDCVRLALEDGRKRVRDGADVSALLEPSYLERRRREDVRAAGESRGGTVYLCAVDGERMAVSFIQSLFDGWGSQVVAPGTGIVLQNRGSGFALSGRVEPGRRPYHTIIPGLLVRDGVLWGPFGVMGGYMQAQGHVQVISALVDGGLDPQAALDRPRFRVDGERVLVEPGLDLPGGLLIEDDPSVFGGGQAILVEGETLVGGSDPRKDGYAGGL